MFLLAIYKWFSPARICLVLAVALLAFGCGLVSGPSNNSSLTDESIKQKTHESEVAANQIPSQPDLNVSTEIPNLSFPSKPDATTSPIGKIDFRNRSYPLPYGWQDSDGNDAKLENGVRKISEDKIGLEYVTVRFGDLGGTKDDEAVVVIRINTAGSALPHLIYVFDDDNGAARLIWSFRTGDRADGGLKDLLFQNGELVIELFGQDRYIFNGLETLKIHGDEEQLCCPTYFTRTRYKWNGRAFVMQGKRVTYSLKDKNEPPVENKGDLIAEEEKRSSK